MSLTTITRRLRAGALLAAAVAALPHEAAAQDAEIQDAIDVWFESAISDIHQGLDRADRFPPSSRRVRGTLAFGQLEFTSRRWMRHGWDVDRDETHALLTESWMNLLVG